MRLYTVVKDYFLSLIPALSSPALVPAIVIIVMLMIAVVLGGVMFAIHQLRKNKSMSLCVFILFFPILFFISVHVHLIHSAKPAV